jgi:L,D-peptidoglycan transpeptidase YkuD (ErfK/YbiS/YcfS/YnhG family)
VTRTGGPDGHRDIVVQGLYRRATTGSVWLAGIGARCALGRAGRRAIKREGDGATPIGRWLILEVLYRADRVRRPRTPLPVRALRPGDGWCDAVGDRNYNRAIRHPYPASAEAMWRADHLYDIVAVLSHNTRPRIQGAGSAIFMHLAGPGFAPTAGCVALEAAALRRMLAAATRGTCVRVLA